MPEIEAWCGETLRPIFGGGALDVGSTAMPPS